jgi:hypothetical protein
MVVSFQAGGQLAVFGLVPERRIDKRLYITVMMDGGKALALRF